MLMLAVQEQTGAADAPSRSAFSPVHDAVRVAPVDPAESAHRLSAAIEHHRSESRRLAKEARQHRVTLRELLQKRDRHMTHLRAAGWHVGRIGTLYKITRARVGQITTALRSEIDDGVGATS